MMHSFEWKRMTFVENIKRRGIPVVLCGIFYFCLCIFSIIVGMSCIITNSTNAGLQQAELSTSSYSQLQAMIPIPISIFFGIVTVVVGIAQGVSAYCLLAGKKKVCWGFAMGFTVFSLLSCASKFLSTVSAFTVLKTVAYILVLIAIFLKCARKKM